MGVDAGMDAGNLKQEAGKKYSYLVSGFQLQVSILASIPSSQFPASCV